MSIFTNIARTIKGFFNDLIEYIQDPIRDAKQILRELDSNIEKAESSLIELKAQITVHKSKRNKSLEKINKYNKSAKKAIDNGNEILAQESLSLQILSEEEYNFFEKELSLLEPCVKQLQDQIESMNVKRNNINVRSNIIKVKKQIAQAKDTASSILGGIGGKNLYKDFKKIEDQIQIQNARSDARLNSIDSQTKVRVHNQLENMNHKKLIQKKLTKLRKQIQYYKKENK